ncbi:V-type ATPase subunit a family protein [bacterium]|nr:V-type ATPase subunit a family protein [bacterium]
MKMNKQTIKENLADMSALSQSKTPSAALKYIEELEAANEHLRLEVQQVNENAKELRANLSKALAVGQKAVQQLRLQGKK